MKGSLLLFNLKLNCLIIFYQSKQVTDYIFMDIYCTLSKCIGHTPCSNEHYLVYSYSVLISLYCIVFSGIFLCVLSSWLCVSDTCLVNCLLTVASVLLGAVASWTVEDPFCSILTTQSRRSFDSDSVFPLKTCCHPWLLICRWVSVFLQLRVPCVISTWCRMGLIHKRCLNKFFYSFDWSS